MSFSEGEYVVLVDLVVEMLDAGASPEELVEVVRGAVDGWRDRQ